MREPLDRLLHWRYGPRLELPPGHFAVSTGRHRPPLHASDDGGGAPCIVDIVSALPSPWIPRSVYRIAGSGGVVVAEAGGGDDDRRVRRIAEHFPVRSRVQHLGLDGAVALKQESRPVAVLGDRTRSAPVPYECGDHVAARTETACEIDGFVAPVGNVRSLGAGGHLLAVDVQSIPIVRGNVDHEPVRNRRQVECSSRVKHGEAVGRRAWRRDPARWRRVLENARLLRVENLGQRARYGARRQDPTRSRVSHRPSDRSPLPLIADRICSATA